VEQAVFKWVTAQNKGDFEIYQKLYAKKFTGLKRSEDRVVNFGREGWMKDRGEMFEEPFTVVATNISVSFAPNLAVATFEQSWKGETYQDRGMKRLLFVEEGKQLVISREEMLTSDTGTGKEALEIPFEKAALAAKTLDSFLLLIPGKAEVNWATDHPRYISNERAQRAVSTAALPARLKKHLDARYEVFDESGKQCEVEPRGFQLMIRVIPHFGTVNFWEGRTGSDDPVVLVPQQGRAINLWEMATAFQTETSSQGLTLGLEMKPIKDCKEPVWGRVITKESATPWTVEAPDEPDAKSLKDAVPRHPVVVHLNQSARKHSSDSDWFEDLRQDSLRVLKSGMGTELFYAQAVGLGGCGYTTPTSVGLLFRKQGGTLVPLKEELHPDGLIRAAVDIDGNGEVELIAETSIVAKGKEGYVHAVDLFPLYLDCPC
jgi:hypothetical protein